MEVAVLKIEVYINSAWVDISADVMAPISGNRGIMRNGPLDRVGDPGYLNFGMNNSIANSAGLAGYYSPGHWISDQSNHNYSTLRPLARNHYFYLRSALSTSWDFYKECLWKNFLRWRFRLSQP